MLADGPGGGGGKGKVDAMSFQWKATSPSIHEGNRYDLTITNTSDEAQEARIRTGAMDYRQPHHTDVVDEQIIVLWSRASQNHEPGRKESQDEVSRAIG